MSKRLVDVTLHIDETTDHEQREALRDAMLAKNGTISKPTAYWSSILSP